MVEIARSNAAARASFVAVLMLGCFQATKWW